MLPRELLHPVIVQGVWSDFTRGDYESAVFKAAKEVEAAVRKACGYGPEEYGVSMMRKAFDKDRGPLTDKSLPEAERQAMAHMFAGQIGFYKNSTGHRFVPIDNPVKAVGILMSASNLLGIVDELSATP